MSSVTERITVYYKKRGYKMPDAFLSLAWATTEMGEAYELLLQRQGGWTRNNPEDKPAWDVDKYAEELGDILMMVVMAGLAEGVDPVDALLRKMSTKLGEGHAGQP